MAIHEAAIEHARPQAEPVATERVDPLSMLGLAPLGHSALADADTGARTGAMTNVQRVAGNRAATRLAEQASSLAWHGRPVIHRLVVGRPAMLRGATVQRRNHEERPRPNATGTATSSAAATPATATAAATTAEGASGPAAGSIAPDSAAATPPAPPAGAPSDVPALTNPRFSGMPRLQAIAAGGPALGSRDPRPVVRAVQQALLDLGYSLLRYHTDGRFGGETTEAIRQFRVDRRLLADGGLNFAAILELDRAAPPPGTALEHYVDYDRLFADGQFDVTLALGYDDPTRRRAGLHEHNIRDAHAWLDAQHFEAVTASGGDAASGPVELWRATRRLTYPTRSGRRVEREITVNFRLILPGTGAAAAYGRALNESELTIYAGHARRGIGPDFDVDRSPTENFVLGVNSALHAAGRAVAPTAVERHHYVIDRVNDLEEMTQTGQFDRERYRIWFFNACSTIAYLDELRGGILPADMDRSNLDIFGTTTPPATFQVLSRTSLAMLEGILEAETMEGILRRMDRVGTEAMRGMGFSDRDIRAVFQAAPYFREGAGDNPVAPPAPAVPGAPEAAAP